MLGNIGKAMWYMFEECTISHPKEDAFIPMIFCGLLGKVLNVPLTLRLGETSLNYV